MAWRQLSSDKLDAGFHREHAGRADQDVNPPMLLDHLARKPFHTGLIEDIHRASLGHAPVGLDLRHHVGRASLIATGDHHPGTTPPQRNRAGLADAAGAAHNHRDTVCDVENLCKEVSWGNRG